MKIITINLYHNLIGRLIICHVDILGSNSKHALLTFRSHKFYIANGVLEEIRAPEILKFCSSVCSRLPGVVKAIIYSYMSSNTCFVELRSLGNNCYVYK